MKKEDLLTLFDAARWAPSAFNTQPWRFVYAIAGTPDFDLLFSHLTDGNKVWCKNAGALAVIISKNLDDRGKPSPTHSFDTGAAWENLALQGAFMSLVTHGMAGYNADNLRSSLNLSSDFSIEAMLAIGYPGDPSLLPEKVQLGETPNGRRPLSEIAFEGIASAQNLS